MRRGSWSTRPSRSGRPTGWPSRPGFGRKLAVARELGAAEVVDYSRPHWTEGVRLGGRYLPFGAAGGAFGPVDREGASHHGVTVVASPPPSPAENRRLVEEALAAAASRTLRPLIGRRLPLAEAAAARRAIEARGTIGKTLLLP